MNTDQAAEPEASTMWVELKVWRHKGPPRVDMFKVGRSLNMLEARRRATHVQLSRAGLLDVSCFNLQLVYSTRHGSEDGQKG